MINGELIVEWRNTYIYGEQYEVSNTGLVRNKMTKQILKPTKDTKGYLRISLSRNNKQINNCVSNLEWISNYDNMQHAIEHGLTNHVEYAGRKKRPIIGIKDTGEMVRFGSLAEASEKCNVSRSNLCNALKGKRQIEIRGTTMKQPKKELYTR